MAYLSCALSQHFFFFFLNKLTLPNYSWLDKTQQVQKHKKEQNRDFSFLE